MATYQKLTGPTAGQINKITTVAAGDRIVLSDVINHAAKKIVFTLNDTSDVVVYKLNNHQKLSSSLSQDYVPDSEVDRVFNTNNRTYVDFWNTVAPSFTATGALEVETVDGLTIFSIEIVSITPADPSASTITLTVW